MKNDYIEGLKYQAPHPFRTSADRMAKQFSEATVDENGIVRWNSNKRVPPADVLEFWKHIGHEFDLAASTAARDKETEDFLAAYRKNYRGPSEEERLEAQAAFGPGQKIVNVITGHTWTT